MGRTYCILLSCEISLFLSRFMANSVPVGVIIRLDRIIQFFRAFYSILDCPIKSGNDGERSYPNFRYE